MEYNYIQIGVIGAMQRAHPALTELWLSWTGSHNLSMATFDLSKSEYGEMPDTAVSFSTRGGLHDAISDFCDVIGLKPDAPERDKHPIRIEHNSAHHKTFWENMISREFTQLESPLEWWWQLLVLRYRGIKPASRALISHAISPEVDNGLLSFSPPLGLGSKMSDIISGSYCQPKSVVVSFPMKKKDNQFDAISFSLSDDKFKQRFVRTLVTLACARI